MAMAQTPAERRAKRDEYARGLTDPRTGEPFKNYNALDTYQRNVKARAQGYTGRGQERRSKTVGEAAKLFPESWKKFIGDRKASEKLGKDFLRAFGKYPSRVTKKIKETAHTARAEFLDSDDAQDWDWDVWRGEYSAA